MKKLVLIPMSIALALSACSKSKGKSFKSTNAGSEVERNVPRQESEEMSEEEEGKLALICSTEDSKSYKGFGGTELVIGRVTEVPEQGDRYRIKPYSTLEKEFQRVTANVPKSLVANAATFAAAADRWYTEPQGGAVTLFTLYRIAYDAALTYVATDAKWSVAPTESTAKVECQLFARVAWNREPSDLEIQACKQIAVVDTATETDPKMRWAYALASVLNATGFIAY